ncbi:hypothetical protein BDN70DRAFT_884152 [Pholiota conissans]|uniref:Uncharacterized protein n=1 Tax=Pholiota conissans TaxID=109636 RepID=A0A9P5YT53_9AGAR|nr:hypothetical protein BDN70DRAFT_884152 [Pholiota conissans]
MNILPPISDKEMQKKVEDHTYNDLLSLYYAIFNREHSTCTSALNQDGPIAVDKEQSRSITNASVSFPNSVQSLPTHEELRAWRIKPMDTIRTIALSMLMLQNAATQAISTHYNAKSIDKEYPKSFVLISIFSGLTRLLALPLLFFVAGFASHHSMVVHERSPAQFVIRRASKTALLVSLYQGLVYATKSVYPIPRPAREGMEALLNGPTLYILSLFLLDSIYALFRTINLFISGSNAPAHFLTTKLRFDVVKSILVILVMFWVYACGLGYIPLMGPTHEHFPYINSSTELHFLILFLVAYAAGIHFLNYAKYITNIESIISPLRTLSYSFIYSLAMLCYLIYAFPTLSTFLDVRKHPSLPFVDPDAAGAYTMWVMTVLLTVVEALIRAVFTHPMLKVDHGRLYHVYFPVHLPVLFGLAYIPGTHYTHPIAMWVLFADIALASVYITALGGLVLQKFVRVRSV